MFYKVYNFYSVAIGIHASACLWILWILSLIFYTRITSENIPVIYLVISVQAPNKKIIFFHFFEKFFGIVILIILKIALPVVYIWLIFQIIHRNGICKNLSKIEKQYYSDCCGPIPVKLNGEIIHFNFFLSSFFQSFAKSLIICDRVLLDKGTRLIFSKETLHDVFITFC